MDILFISEQTRNELYQYCEKELVSLVLTDFSKCGIIKEPKNTDNERPKRWWVITNYISNNTIPIRKKLSVILSLAAIEGYIQIGDYTRKGDINVLNMLKDLFYISEQDYSYFAEAFCDFSHGSGKKIK